MANDDKVACQGIANYLSLQIALEEFSVKVFTIPLGSLDVILGVDFLRTLGPILWNLDDLCMAFWHRDQHILWKGLGSTRWDIEMKVAARAARADPTPLMDMLLQQFAGVFRELSDVPPARSCDHRIHLKPGTPPIAVRPYCYPQLQKDELETQCASMLGIIRPSTSTFSALVPLVRKQDKSWRFCIDYLALNEQTVKDKYPIPIVDELLDELHDAFLFTKMDLRSGYYQVRAHLDDVHKTTFQTHHGHFEFLVVPSGLTNAPATFQSLMNEVLRPFLRWCVLVFFDDILIYSKPWSEHLQHVKAVLETLQANHRESPWTTARWRQSPHGRPPALPMASADFWDWQGIIASSTKISA